MFFKRREINNCIESEINQLLSAYRNLPNKQMKATLDEIKEQNHMSTLKAELKRRIANNEQITLAIAYLSIATSIFVTFYGSVCENQIVFMANITEVMLVIIIVLILVTWRLNSYKSKYIGLVSLIEDYEVAINRNQKYRIKVKGYKQTLFKI